MGDFMRIGCIAWHGLVLTLADLAGVVVGSVVAYRLSGQADQIWIQLPVALVITIGLVIGWLLALRRSRFRRFLPASPAELGASVAASLGWGVGLFLPLHFVTQGYVTAVGNLVALAVYQLLVNTVAMFGGAALTGGDPSERRPAG